MGMSDAQAIGDMVEGTLKARAIEPRAGEDAPSGDEGHTHETACLNCGTPLVGSHCHACGQAAHGEVGEPAGGGLEVLDLTAEGDDVVIRVAQP